MVKRMVYDGISDKQIINMGSKKVVLKYGVATIVDDDVFEYLMDCRKRLNVHPVLEIEKSLKNRLKDRVIKEE